MPVFGSPFVHGFIQIVRLDFGGYAVLPYNRVAFLWALFMQCLFETVRLDPLRLASCSDHVTRPACHSSMVFILSKLTYGSLLATLFFGLLDGYPASFC